MSCSCAAGAGHLDDRGEDRRDGVAHAHGEGASAAVEGVAGVVPTQDFLVQLQHRRPFARAERSQIRRAYRWISWAPSFWTILAPGVLGATAQIDSLILAGLDEIAPARRWVAALAARVRAGWARGSLHP